jgi:hypothetical protein
MLAAAVAVILAAGSVAGASLAGRESTATRTAHSTEKLYADVQDLSYDLADSNATAATSLLIGPETPGGFSSRFQQDLANAEELLSQASQQVAGDAYASAQLTELAEQIPVYTGLVGQAQAENRFGYPVAGAYLRQASDMLNSMLTESGNVATEQQAATESGISSASGFAVLVLVAVIIALALLWLISRGLARTAHRRLNPGLIGAAAVMVGLFVWSLSAYGSASGDGNLAGADFSGVVASKTDASQLSLAETYVALQQIDRGEDQGKDATAAVNALKAANPARSTGSEAAEHDYTAVADCVQSSITLASGGQYVSATTAMVGSGTSVGRGGCEPRAQTLYKDLQNLDGASQSKFDHDMSSLAGDYAGSAALPIGLVAGLIGACVAAYGLNRRLAEYR